MAALVSLTVGAQAADKYSILHTFNSSTGGIFPSGDLLMDQAGNLYGAASQGGTNRAGTIFELTPNAHGGWNYTVLYNCTVSDCYLPLGCLVMDSAGNLYGTSYFGNVFEITQNEAGGWSAIVLYTFDGGDNGTYPSPVILDAAGNLYGANANGGSQNLGFVFELSHSDGGWSLIHLHDFDGSDGAEGYAGLIMDASGNLYGTASAGGNYNACSGGCGVFFELKNHSGAWTETVLHSFDGSDGANPGAPLLMDSAGNFYGTATGGGTRGFGVVVKTSAVSGGWQTSVLHNFTGTHLDGEFPDTALVMDGAGNLYGTTDSGGGGHINCSTGTADTGCGMVFELSSSQNRWTESILKAFSGGNDGGFPQGVILDAAGNLYGVAEAGGRLSEGVVFEISPNSR